jgi:hypothetical protein
MPAHLEKRGGVQQGPVSSQAYDEVYLVGNIVVIYAADKSQDNAIAWSPQHSST